MDGTLSTDETLSADKADDLDETLPYSNDVGYRIGFDPKALLVHSSDSEPEFETDDVELLTHKFIPQEDPAPFSTSFVEEEGEDGNMGGGDGEEVQEVEVGAQVGVTESQATKVSKAWEEVLIKFQN